MDMMGGRCFTAATVPQDAEPILEIKGWCMLSLTLIHIFPPTGHIWLCTDAEATKEHRAAIVNRICKVDGGIHNDTSVLADDGEGV